MVGPWQISNDIQRSRAEFHSNETHRIPLNIASTQLDKRQLVMEILGRCEPEIARRQGIRVGLYTEEIAIGAMIPSRAARSRRVLLESAVNPLLSTLR
ncbi:hypothetical protein Y032_0196g1542 [Ancylostoma ceylanicum]|uniref:Maelstrom domain-containing protein n=1 Tax=Ancylostoma ceylanicum TaxID=53326 RepID=A0A016SNS6_9BILA|nr:hypothetical protein Y032_0196g1542 [Ancylostoma ceylanicum]